MGRMDAFLRLVNPLPGSRVLDLGGTPYMWSLFPHDFHVTLVNLPDSTDLAVDAPGFTVVAADACDLGDVFEDDAFDIVFSNSVIEHVGDVHRQIAFANEARRLAPAYWIQTPSPHFPIEAHTGVPFYWRRSSRDRARLMAKWQRDLPIWAEMIAGTTVLAEPLMEDLFPDGHTFKERLGGLEKSIVRYRPTVAGSRERARRRGAILPTRARERAVGASSSAG